MKKYYVGLISAGVLVLFSIIGLSLNPWSNYKFVLNPLAPVPESAAGDWFLMVGAGIVILGTAAVILYRIYRFVRLIYRKIKKGSDKLC